MFILFVFNFAFSLVYKVHRFYLEVCDFLACVLVESYTHTLSEFLTMAPQSYELSFVGSLLLIILCILLAVLAANLIVNILRYVLSYVLGIISPETASRLVESATQTQAGDCDDNAVKSQSGEKQVEVPSAAGGEGKKKD